jgi:N,N'-diacetyllegionaminate synthase
MTSKIKSPVYIVAEAGINHNSDIKIAKKMIEVASKCGADAIKFQTFTPDELFSELINPELYNLSKTWVLTKSDHIELQKHAKKNKITFFSTPCGIKSVNLLKKLKVPLIKIASGEITNLDLINYISKIKIPMMISTGMTSISEISKVVEIVQSNNCPFSLLHCVSSYPAKNSDANLATIPYLQKTFDVPVGFSDHSLGIDISLAAVALGATIIEKHFTLDKNMPGPDQKLSIDPSELTDLVKKIRIIEKAMGNSRKTVFKTEESFRTNMRKSLGTTQNIPANTIIKRSMITSFRPGIGIPPYFIDEFIGRKTKKNIKKGSLLNWDFF